MNEKMKRLLLLFVFWGIRIGFAQQDGLGIGLMAGEPSGLSIKTFVGDNAFSAAAAWSITNDYFYAHLDYLQHNQPLANNLPWYIGIGGAVGFGKRDTDIIARVPIGITYLFSAPFDIFAELVPGLRIIPETDFVLMGGLGFHFYLQ